VLELDSESGKVDWRSGGRDAEIADISTLLSAASGAPAALMITGDAGIGETIVSRDVLKTVGESFRMLSCQPAPAERPLASSALDDLLGEVASEVLPALLGRDGEPWRTRFSVTRPQEPPQTVFPKPTGRRRIHGCWHEGPGWSNGSSPALRRSWLPG
jgi:hypothetical protein